MINFTQTHKNMKKFFSFKNVILAALLVLMNSASWGQSAGFNNTFIVLSLNGGANAYYDLNATTANTDFNGASLGTFAAGSSSLILKGAEHNVYKCGGADLTSTRLYYRIYLTASPSGSYTSQSIGYTSGGANGCGGQNQQWSNTGLTTNLLTGLGAGAYTIEVYSDATITCCGGTAFAANSSNNYKATFTVSSIEWANTGSSSAWYTAINWNPSTASGSWLVGSQAVFQNAGSATTAGINMGTAALSIGAIDVTSTRARALTIGNNSGTAGNLTLNGLALSGNANVILRNSSSSLLTLQNNETGANKTMNVALGNATTNVIDAAGAGGITISSNISGASRSITKIGTSGTLTLSGTNTYSGGTIISGGTVSAGAAANLGDAAGAITLGSGATSATLAATGSFTRNAVNITTSSSAGVIDVASSQTLTVGALNTASGTDNTTKIGKSGAGTLTLSGAGTYVGQTQIGQGTVIVSNNAGLGANNSTTARGIDLGLNVGDVSQANNVSVLATTGITVPQSIYVAPNTTSATRTIGTSGTTASATFSNEVYLDGTATLAPVSGGTLTMSGNIINTGGLTTTTGTTVLSGTNTYSGTTTVSSGTLRLGSTSALGSTAAGTSITSGAVLDLNGINYSSAEALTVNGTGISSGGAIINGSVTGATYAGLLTLGSASSILGGTGTIAISNTGTITGSGFGLTLGGAQGGSIAGIIGTGTGTLTKQDAGTWTLTNSSHTFTGTTTITAGELRLNPSANASYASQIVLNGGKLSTTGITATRTWTSTSTLNLNANSTIDLASGTAHTISFLASNGVTWAGSTLTINNWTGTVLTGPGTGGRIFVGAADTALTPAQLAKITFTGYNAGATILSTGEVVPTSSPAPPTITSTSGVVASAPGSGLSGYVGNTITINGTGLNNVTEVRVGGSTGTIVTITGQTATTLTFAAINLGGKIYVQNVTGNTTSTETYINLGYITTGTPTNWNTPASWLGGAVPAASSDVTIAHALSIAAAFTPTTNNPIASITVNTGITLTASATVAIGTVTNAITTVGSGVFTFSGAGGSIIVGSFVNNGTLSWSAAATLNISAGGTLTNNETFTRGTGTVTFAGTGTVTGTVAFNNLTLNGALTNPTTVTVNGTLQLNTGATLSNSPAYGTSSTLVYNQAGSINNGNEWVAGASGAGVPQNVTTQNTASLTLTGGSAYTILGNVNIATGSTLALSTTSGGNLSIRGNWSRGGTFTPNSRTVTFNGTAAGQTINNTTSFFDIVIDNTDAAGVLVATSNNLTVTNSLVVNASRLLDLNAGIVHSGSTFTVNGTLRISAGGFVQNASPAPVYGAASALIYNAFTYGRSNEWNATGVGTIGTTAGYPNNVTINTGTFDIVNTSNFARAMNGTLTVNTGATFNVNALNAALTIGGGLTTVGTGTFSMGSTNAAVTVAGALTNAGTVTLSTATASLTVGGAVSNSGALTLSSNIGGDIYVAGNFTNSGTFTHSSRALFLNGTTQTLGGSNINGSGTTNCFPYLFLQNGTNVTLAASAAVTNTLTLTSGKITLSTFDLNMGASAISGASSSNYIVTNSTGQLKRTVTSSAVTFPVGNSAYNPITFTNALDSDIYGIRVVDGAPINALDPLVTVQRSWYITEALAGGSNLTPVVAQYNSGEVGTNYNAGTTPYMGLYNGTAWSQVATTLGGSITATSTGTNQFPATILAGSYIAIGKDQGLASTPPSITSFSATSGYSGSSITISGAYLTGATAVSFGGTAAASFTVDNANQITAIVGTGGTSGTSVSVSITTPSGSTSLAGFTYLGFITTSGASNWNTGASWLGGAVPTANTDVTVAHDLNIAAAFTPTTNNPIASITVNTGITVTASATVAIGTVTNAITTSGTGVFTFSGAGGSIIAGSVVNGGTLSWSAAATLNISAAGTLTNNGTFTRGAGTVTILNAATINGSNAITFNNLTLTAGVATFTTIPTIDGTLSINGGNVSAAPIYTSTSTLFYGIAYNRFNEWNATGIGTIGTTAGYPNNVTVNTGTLDVANGSTLARAMNGNLLVNAGGAFNLNAINAIVTVGGNLTTTGTGAVNMGSTNLGLYVIGSLSIAATGALTLSSVSGGDIYVAGGFANSGTFTHNTRAVFLNGTTQTVSGSALNTSGTTNCFDYLFLQNGTNATLGASVTIRNGLTFTSGKITLGANDLNVGAATITTPTSSSYVVTNSTGQLKRTVASSVLFPVGNTAYDPITLNNSGTSDTYGVVVVEGAVSTTNDATYTINRRWQVTEAVSGNSNLAVTAQYNTGEENTNYNSGTTNYLGFYNGTSWTQQAATRSGSNPFTVASNSNFNLTAANLTTGTQYFAIGKDLAFLPAAPTVTSVDVASAYSGSTVVITGTSFTGATAVSFGPTAAASFTVNSATQITAVVGTGGASGDVSVTTPSGTGSLAGFTYLGFITTSGATTWATAASWLGNAVPSTGATTTIAHGLSIATAIANPPATITVNNGITLDVNNASGSITASTSVTNNGTVTFSAAGAMTTPTFTNAGTLSWSAAATLIISAGGTLTNNGTFTRGTGTVVFANAGTVNGSGAITFNNLTLTSGVLSLATTPTIAGTFALNGGSISTNAPFYTNTSTLQYGANYTRFLEWSASGVGTIGTTAGYPNNVTISAGTFTVLNSDAGIPRAMAGNLTVNTGCTFTTGALNAVLTIGGNLTTTGTGNFNMSNSSAAVTVLGSVSNAGTLALSSTSGGDLNVAGNWTRTGTFTPNSRAVTFNGTTAQAMIGVTTFAFLSITNSSADVTAANAITVTSNLTINGSATLTRLNMAANTLTLTGATSTITSGFLRSAGTITGGTNTFGANGTYEHNLNAGTIPTATWNSGSTCAIIGCTATQPSGLGQSFHHFTWNCSSQTTTVNILGALTTVNGNFSVINTNTATSGLRLQNGAYTLAIGGDLIVSAATGITSRLDLNGATGSGVINLSGNLFLTTAGTGVATILKTGGTQAINFVKSSGTQTITQSGGAFAAAQTININIGNGTSTNTVQLASNVNLGTGTGTFTVLGNATFDAGTNVLSGSGASTFNSGANIITANTGGVNGSVTLSGTRTYNAAANYTFNNSTPLAQVTGAAITAANNITLNNSAGVSLSAGTTVSGILTHTSGKLTLGANTLTLNGTVSGINASNSLVGSSTSNLTIGGTGALGTLFFDQTTPGTTNTLSSLSINRTAGSGTAGATLGSVLNVTTTFALTSTSTLTLGGNLTVSASGSNSAAGIIAGTGALIKTGAGTLTLTAASGNNTANAYSDGTTVNGAGTGTISVTGLTNITSASITSATQSVTFSTTTPANGTYQLLPGTLTVGTQSFTHNAGPTKAVTFNYTNSTVTVATATITTSAISPTTYCAGDNVSVDFTTSGSLSGTYTAQLSNADGSFASPVAIGTGSTTTISATIPSGTSDGTGYRIRVVNTGNNITGTDNGSNITVNNPSTEAVLSGTTSICNGGSTNLSVAITGGTSPFTVIYSDGISNFTVNSYTSGANISVSPTSTTTYSLVSVTSTGGCSGTNNSGSAVVTVNNPSTAATLSGTTSICNGGSTNLSVAITGGTSPFTVVYSDGSNNFTVSGYTSGANISVSPTATTTYSLVSVTSTIDCTGAGNSGTAVVSVGVPANTIVLSSGSSAQSLCNPADFVTITYTTANATGATFSGLPNGVTGNWLANVVTISGTPTVNGSFPYTVSLTGGCGNVSATGTISSYSTTWTVTNSVGSWSHGAPTATVGAIIAGNYSDATDLTACSLIVNNNAVVTVPSGFDFNISGAVDVQSGSLTFENNANLLQGGTANVNTGEITSKRINSSMRRLDYTYWSSPTAKADYSLKMFSPMTMSLIPFTPGGVTGASRFYYINEPTNAFVSVEPTQTFFNDANIARGWSIRAPNNFPTNGALATFNANFIGKPNSGNITIPVTFTSTEGNGPVKGSNLIGNPYPSAIDATAFLNYSPDNGNTKPNAGTIYFWTHTTQNSGGNNYAAYNLSGGTKAAAVTSNNSDVISAATPNGTIQVGQGFILKKAASSIVVFNNAMRIGNNQGQFFKTATTEKHRIWLNLATDTTPLSQMMVGYIEGTTLGFDDSYDGKLINPGSTISSIIDNENYVIQARPTPFVNTDEVPLNFNATTAGSYTLSIDHVDGLFLGDQNIYLRDNLLNITHDIKASAYTFTSDQGTFSDRFDVVYNNSTLNISTPTFDANSVVVYKDDNSVLNINAGKVVMENVKIYDVRGRLIYEKSNINTTTTALNDLKAEQQVLLVKITSDDNKVVTKKVVF